MGSSNKMGRRAFTISLLAFLGFVILQTVSAEEPSEELAAQLNSNAGSLLEPSENQFRLIRSPERRKKKKDKNQGKKKEIPGRKRKGEKRGKRRRPGQGRSGFKKSKGKSGRKPWPKKIRERTGKGKGGKGSRNGGKNKRNGRKGNRNGGKKWKPYKENVNIKVKQATCDEKELCKKIKLYIKYSNQQRKAKRILRTCKTLKNKHDKAETEFEATAAAIKDSDDANVTAIQAVLEKCKNTAKAICAVTNVPECADAEQTKINECITKLKTWIEAFGPGSESCLGQENCCNCINAIEPPVPDECLSYEATDMKSLGKKNMCTKNESNGGGTGSFGECRKKQQAAAEQGPPAFGKKCKNGGMTTAKASGRRRKAVLKIRKELNKK